MEWEEQGIISPGSLGRMKAGDQGDFGPPAAEVSHLLWYLAVLNMIPLHRLKGLLGSRFLFTSFLLHRHILYSLVHSKSIYQELTVCCVLTLYPQESHSLGRETDQQVSKVIVCEALSGWMEHGCLGSTEKGCLLQSW